MREEKKCRHDSNPSAEWLQHPSFFSLNINDSRNFFRFNPDHSPHLPHPANHTTAVSLLLTATQMIFHSTNNNKKTKAKKQKKNKTRKKVKQQETGLMDMQKKKKEVQTKCWAYLPSAWLGRGQGHQKEGLGVWSPDSCHCCTWHWGWSVWSSQFSVCCIHCICSDCPVTETKHFFFPKKK